MKHVIVRGNERKAVFRDDVDRELNLLRVAHYREKFGFRLLAYCPLSEELVAVLCSQHAT